MIDAILFAARDSIRASGFGYGTQQCEIAGPDGKPPPDMGNLFVSVHPQATRNDSLRNLDEYFDWALTLTMRVVVPLDRLGDMLMASKLARRAGPGQPSFTARLEQLRAWGHANWRITVMPGQTPPSANDNLVAWAPAGVASVYGFVQPARFAGADTPRIVGGEWFTAAPEATDTGLVASLRFTGARRMQPQTLAVGPFV